MLHFLVSGLVFTVLFLLPLLLLPLAAAGIYRLQRRRTESATPAELRLHYLNFNVNRYLISLLLTPGIMLVTSVCIGLTAGKATMLDSLLWLTVAITFAFSWYISRLVISVSARTRFTEELQAAGSGGPGLE